MEGNSPKHLETNRGHLSSVSALSKWLEHEAGNQRVPSVIALLASVTETALRERQSPPAVEVESLAQRYFDVHGGSLRGESAGKWLRRGRVEDWWKARERQIELACQRADCTCVPHLVIRTGGGRGNSTEYAIAFRPLLEEALTSGPVTTDDANSAVREIPVIRYDVDQAKTAWWVGWLSTVPQFHVRSWRGLALLGMIALAFVWGVLSASVIGLSMWHDRSLSGRDVVSMFIAAAVAWMFWSTFRSICLLPWERVTLAPDAMLQNDQFHAQFRLTRNTRKRSLGGWFSVVRHWGICPLCSAEVDVRSGAESFPGRLVGRCEDSPLEHVYSFDPVTLAGRLITDYAPIAPRHGCDNSQPFT